MAEASKLWVWTESRGLKEVSVLPHGAKSVSEVRAPWVVYRFKDEGTVQERILGGRMAWHRDRWKLAAIVTDHLEEAERKAASDLATIQEALRDFHQALAEADPDGVA